MATTVGNLITLDGQFADWPPADSLMQTGNSVAGYQVYGALLNDANIGTYVIGINGTSPTDPVIGLNTTIYLNTDQNISTGYSPFGAVVGRRQQPAAARHPECGVRHHADPVAGHLPHG